MVDDRQAKDLPTQLPSALVERLTQPFSQFLRIETSAGAVLLAATLLALLLSNSRWADAYLTLWETHVGLQIGSREVVRSVKEWINDGLMTLFFFLVALELKRELVLGELGQPRVAALSIAAALGGMLVPAAVYLMLQSGQPGGAGWGAVMATDTAFVIGCLALLGPRIPPSLRVFMLSLAITDDIGAILVVAVGYTKHVAWWPLALGMSGCILVRGMSALGIRSVPLYFLVGGMVWAAIDASGIHATVTGVVLGLLTPARRWVSDDRLYALLDQVVAHPSARSGSGITPDRRTLQVAEIAAREALSPVERLELGLHPWVGFVVIPSSRWRTQECRSQDASGKALWRWRCLAGSSSASPLVSSRSAGWPCAGASRDVRLTLRGGSWLAEGCLPVSASQWRCSSPIWHSAPI